MKLLIVITFISLLGAFITGCASNKSPADAPTPAYTTYYFPVYYPSYYYAPFVDQYYQPGPYNNNFNYYGYYGYWGNR